MHRKPAVAGSFYPAEPDALRREVIACLGPPGGGGERARAALVPHAGYVYSGRCAGATYAKLAPPELVLVLGPNHTGRGAALAITDEGEWETPLGSVPIDAALGRTLRELDPDVVPDSAAHLREHSIEVQLPFLQVLRPAVRFLPLCVGTHRLGALLSLGDAIAEAIGSASVDVLVLISSDMSHYIPFEEARRRDALAIEKMEGLDAEGLHEVVERERITMCGYCPAVAGIRAAGRLGATRGRVAAYTSSGDTTGDYSDVVAYAGLIFN